MRKVHRNKALKPIGLASPVGLCECVYYCTQLLYTIQHMVLIIFTFIH